MQQTITNRVVIYAKGIINITGSKERAARKLFIQIRKKYQKEPGSFITVYDFREFTGLIEESVKQFLST